MDLLCHPGVTTTNLSYRFPIFETSATALCGTTGTGGSGGGSSNSSSRSSSSTTTTAAAGGGGAGGGGVVVVVIVIVAVVVVVVVVGASGCLSVYIMWQASRQASRLWKLQLPLMLWKLQQNRHFARMRQASRPASRLWK